MKNNLHDIGMMYMTRTPVQQNVEVSKLNITNNTFHLLCKTGNERQIKDALIYLNVDPSFNRSRSLVFAVRSGKLDNVKILLNDNRVDPTSLNFMAIGESVKNNHTDIFYLLKHHIIFYMREHNKDMKCFYDAYLSLICEYERIDMLNMTHEDVIGIKFDHKTQFLNIIFADYDDTKKHFLDTLIERCELRHISVFMASSESTIEGLEYGIRLCLEKEYNIPQYIIDNCIGRAMGNILPDNVKRLLDFSGIITPNIYSVESILDFIDIKRSKEEIIEDFIKLAEILFNNNPKINRWHKNLIKFIIQLSTSNMNYDKAIFNILFPYFFTKEGIPIMKLLLKDEIDIQDNFDTIVETMLYNAENDKCTIL